MVMLYAQVMLFLLVSFASADDTSHENTTIETTLLSNIRMLDLLKADLLKIRSNFNKYDLKAPRIKDEGRAIALDLEKFIHDPIRRISLMQRYVYDWRNIMMFLKDTAKIYESFASKVTAMEKIIVSEYRDGSNSTELLVNLNSLFDKLLPQISNNYRKDLWSVLRHLHK